MLNRAVDYNTTTRSGGEQNFARFEVSISCYLSNADTDLDKDGQTSVLEAFLVASRQLSDFYDAEGRLATEHPLIDDNGDQLGTPLNGFGGSTSKKVCRWFARWLPSHQFLSCSW